MSRFRAVMRDWIASRSVSKRACKRRITCGVSPSMFSYSTGSRHADTRYGSSDYPTDYAAMPISFSDQQECGGCGGARRIGILPWLTLVSARRQYDQNRAEASLVLDVVASG